MRKAIEEILNGIPNGHIFDSHFVINKLIQKYSDVYLEYSGTISGSNKTLPVHGKIGQEIAKLESGGLIRRLENMSYSQNIHIGDSSCTAWIKK